MTKVANCSDEQLREIIKRAPTNIWMWTRRQMDAHVELQNRGQTVKRASRARARLCQYK